MSALIIALLLAGCLRDHPVIGGENVVDLNDYLHSADFPPGMAWVEVHLADEALAPVTTHWKGEVKHFDRMPHYLRGDDEKIRLVLKGFREDMTPCYAATVVDHWAARVETLNACEDIPVVALQLKDTVRYLVGDSLTWEAHVAVKYGHLARSLTEFAGGWARSEDTLVGKDTVLTGRFKCFKPGTFNLAFTAWTTTGLKATAMLEVLMSEPGTDPKPRILSLSASDTLINIHDSVTFTGILKLASSQIMVGWGDEPMVSLSGNPGSPLQVTHGMRFAEPGTYSLDLRIKDGSHDSSLASPKVRVVLDPPRLQVPQDTNVEPGALLVLRGSAWDGLGKVTAMEWSVPGDTVLDSLRPIIEIRAPSTLGVHSFVFRARDDDGLVDSATMQVFVIAPKDTTVDLSSLSVSAGGVSPAFDPKILSYALTVPYETTLVDLEAIARNPGSRVSHLGVSRIGRHSVSQLRLAPGANPVSFIVVAPDGGAQQAYFLTITRKPGPPPPRTRMGTATVAYPPPPYGSGQAEIYDIYNSSGKGAALAQPAVGRYQVDFPGLASGTASLGNVQVTPFGPTPARCVIESWSGDFTVKVNCFDLAGAPRNSGFTVMAHWERPRATGDKVFALVDFLPGTQATRIRPEAAGNPAGDSMTVTASTTTKGEYYVGAWPRRKAPTHGVPMVTRVGTGKGWCSADVENYSEGQIMVACYSASGEPEESMFSVAAFWPLDDKLDFQMAFSRTIPPSIQERAFNSAAQSVIYRKKDVGSYEFILLGMGYMPRPDLGSATTQVSTTISGAKGTCQVEDFDGRPTEMFAVVRCFGLTGQPIDRPFHLLSTMQVGSGKTQ